jgi:hypothetical protein
MLLVLIDYDTIPVLGNIHDVLLSLGSYDNTYI